MCRELAIRFSTPENSIAGKVPLLKSAISKSREAIEEAKLGATAIMLYNDIEGTIAGKAFNDAVSEIEKCATAYGSSLKGRDEMTKALAADQERMKQLKDKFSQHEKKQPNPNASGTVAITIDATGVKKKSYAAVDKDTRLSAILWQLASECPNDRDKLLNSLHFKDGQTIYGFDQPVPNGKTLTLVMCPS